MDKKRIPVIPDILANTGGVTVSYYEWTQNLQNLYWTKKEIQENLKNKMQQATRAIMKEESSTSNLREAAYSTAIKRLQNTMLLRGWIRPRIKDTVGRFLIRAH